MTELNLATFILTYDFRVGLYFAWLGFYTTMLVIPALLGLLAFIYGLITFTMDDVNHAS